MKKNLTIEARSDRGCRRWNVLMCFDDRYATCNAPTLREAAEEAAKQLGPEAELILREGLKDE